MPALFCVLCIYDNPNYEVANKLICVLYNEEGYCCPMRSDCVAPISPSYSTEPGKFTISKSKVCHTRKNYLIIYIPRTIIITTGVIMYGCKLRKQTICQSCNMCRQSKCVLGVYNMTTKHIIGMLEESIR